MRPLEAINERLLRVTVKFRGRVSVVMFLVAYGQTESTREGGRKRAFWAAPDGAMEEVSNHEQLFVLMDANVHKGLREGGGRFESEHCGVLAAFGRNTRRDNGEHLLTFASKHVALVNTFFSTLKNGTSHTLNE